ncbi:MAG: hypothetical protein Q8Q20_01670 [bacterium]|nr:hypothetical protein [bacterium]
MKPRLLLLTNTANEDPGEHHFLADFLREMFLEWIFQSGQGNVFSKISSDQSEEPFDQKVNRLFTPALAISRTVDA